MSAPAATESAVDLVTRFENTFNTYDVDALMADMTEDCVFEHIAPAAVSFGRHEGQAAVRAVWVSLAEHFPGYRFENRGRIRRGRPVRLPLDHDLAPAGRRHGQRPRGGHLPGAGRQGGGEADLRDAVNRPDAGPRRRRFHTLGRSRGYTASW